MDTRQFFQRIHASTDEIVISTHRPDPTGNNPRGIFWNRGSFDNLDKAVKAAHKWDAEQDTTVYFSVGSFADNAFEDKNGKTKYKRTQELATMFKAVCFDLDVGEGKYDTQGKAWTALSQVLTDLGVPYPIVVSSGNGIHCYWPLTREIRADKWVMLSSALCDALQERGFTFDASKIKDPSMVLRPVGTHHKKQTPWKLVSVIYDPGVDFAPEDLATHLYQWLGKVPVKKAPKKSSVADAVLGAANDVELDKVADKCQQIRALVTSGGFVDHAGQQVEEPLWRASLGFAKYTTDPETSIIALAGRHPDFDLDLNIKKLDGWKGTGPTTCKTFEQHCPTGCEGCPYQGNITSPAQLSTQTTAALETEEGEEREVELPDGYVIHNGMIQQEVTEQEEVDGVIINRTHMEVITRYPMHVTGIFKNYDTGISTFRLAVYFPLVGWKEEDHEMEVLAGGATFDKFLRNRQVFDAISQGQQNRVKRFLVDYLAKVQSLEPTGVDYTHFGWQHDGSFLIGDNVIGGTNDGVDRRLKGAAKRLEQDIGKTGTREGWVNAMKILDLPEAKTMRMMMLIGMGSVLSRAVGNCTGLVSIYSPLTTTGKTLSLHSINSMFGHPKRLLLSKRDTFNSMYSIRGTLNQIPCTVDELTTIEAASAADLVYDFSSGVEKNSMTATRELRDPARWTGPTFVSTNVSLIQQFDLAQANDSALRARCLEITHDDRRLVEKGSDGISRSDRFFDEIEANYGWAYPELVAAVIEMGGDSALWKAGRPKFIERFGTVFRAVDKFAEPMIITGWIMSTIAKKLGLISFDVDDTVRELIAVLHDAHDYTDAHTLDAMDIIGQYMQEYNDQIIVASRKKNDKKETVRLPAPEKAVIRMLVITDDDDNLCRGSYIAVNQHNFKRWLAKTKDGIDRVARELRSMGALIKERERVTMFKGCPGRNPGQAHCLVLDLTHPRYTNELEGTEALKNSTVLEAILGDANG